MKERHEHIEAFVSGQLTAEEAAAFQREMDQDRELAQEVKAYQEIDSSLADTDLNTFVGLLEEANQKHKSEQTADRSPSVIWWSAVGGRLAIAASISIVALCAYLFWPATKADPQKWFNQNFEPYAFQSLRATDDRYPADLMIALELYQNGKYQEAIAGLEPRLNDLEHQIIIRFYLAQALLAERQVARAITLLEQQLSGRATVFDQTNEWSLALAYLVAGRMIEARDMARQIVAVAGHSYAANAKELLSTFPE